MNFSDDQRAEAEALLKDFAKGKVTALAVMRALVKMGLPQVHAREMIQTASGQSDIVED